MKDLRTYLAISLLMTSLILLACGGSDNNQKIETVSYLTEKIGKTDIARSGEPQIYVGQSLFEYINGGAEIYHMYRFIEVATASYNKNGTEVVADIYRFENANFAFGLYTTLRPEERESVEFGIDGFASETTIDFVVGEFVLKVYGYEHTPETKLAISIVAAELEKSLPGTREVPEIYSRLPSESRIAGSEKMYAASFLGINELDEIYSYTYSIGSDTTEFFIAEDNEGKLFSIIKSKAVSDSNTASIISDLHYAPGACVVTKDPYYGDIMSGSKGGMFVGVISYNDNMKSFLNSWVDSIE